jgi:hypothetical protein
MKKAYELENIDDFIKDFNHLTFQLGSVKRISGENQENPDAILELNGQKKIGLEATIAIAPADLPNAKPKVNHPSELFYNPTPAIDELIKRIEEKSLNDYKGEGIDQTWLLISGGSYIPSRDLEERLKQESFTTKFDRIFIHKGLGVDLAEVIKR